MTFPNRPDHDDFWTLAQIVQDNDASQDNRTMTFEDRIGAVIDIDSLSYVATERGKRVLGAHARAIRSLTAAQLLELHAAVAGGWMDAFMAGAAYQARKGQQS